MHATVSRAFEHPHHEGLPSFEEVGLTELLTLDIDVLPYGVVLLDRDGVCVGYNKIEGQMAGVPAGHPLLRTFFRDVAPCMNNHLVAGRLLEQDGLLDVRIAYVLTLKMRPVPVTLRLLRQPGCGVRALLVRWE